MRWDLFPIKFKLYISYIKVYILSEIKMEGKWQKEK